MVDVKCIFSVTENGENGLGDEGADGGNAPRILGLELPRSDTSEHPNRRKNDLLIRLSIADRVDFVRL